MEILGRYKLKLALANCKERGDSVNAYYYYLRKL